MISLKIFAAFLLVLVLNGIAWAEIYETTDADGNPEFTDSPPSGDSQIVDLPQTNVTDTPTAQIPTVQQSDSAAVEQQRIHDNNPVIVHDANSGTEDAHLERLKDYERKHSTTPHEVGDSDSQKPHEVGDSDSQMPHEVGDSDSQMPHEVGDFTKEAPEDYEEYPDRQPTEGHRVHHRVHRR